MASVNAAEATLEVHANKLTARTQVAQVMGSAFPELVFAEKDGEAATANKWMITRSSVDQTVRGMEPLKPRQGNVSVTRDSLERTAALKCATWSVEPGVTVREAPAFVSPAGGEKIVRFRVATPAALLTESALTAPASAQMAGTESTARWKVALETATDMGPAQCLPTEWPGSASVRPGGTGPDVALSLSRAVTIRLIMIETVWWTVRTQSAVRALSVREANSATLCPLP